jgi:hydrogenase expression/formation protein HypC
MCLAVPARVVDTALEEGTLFGKVDFGGISKRVCLDHVRDVKPGDYVLVHVGFALARIDEEEAQRTLRFLREMNELEELGAGPE